MIAEFLLKVSKYGVIYGPFFPVFGRNTAKYGPEITPYWDTSRSDSFQAAHNAWKKTLKGISSVIPVIRKCWGKFFV